MNYKKAKRLVERKMEQGFPKLSSLVEFTSFIEPYSEAFHELHRLCKIAVIIPVTSAACERSFSAMKRIKDYLRNSMSDKRLSNLTLLNIERERSSNLDILMTLLTFLPTIII